MKPEKKEDGAVFIEGVIVLGVAITAFIAVLFIWGKIDTMDKKNRALLAFASLRGQGVYLSSQGSSIRLGVDDFNPDAASAALQQSLSSMMRLVEANTYDGKSSINACIFAIEHQFDTTISCYDPQIDQIRIGIKIDGTPCDTASFLPAIESQLLNHSKGCLTDIGTCSDEAKYTWIAVMTDDQYNEAFLDTKICGPFTDDTNVDTVLPYPIQDTNGYP